jgi:uncharacterized integral membrane protein
MKQKITWKNLFVLIITVVLVVLFLYGAFRLIKVFIYLLTVSNPSVAAAIGAAVIAVFSSVITIMLARYYEAKRERESAHRDKKTELYDSFLKELFKLFLEDTPKKSDTGELVPFLREVQRKLILWSGPGVIKSYAEWHAVVTSQGETPRAKSMIKMIDFFLALRRDLGHSNRGIQREHLIRFMLKNPSLFVSMYKKNPNVTFSEIAAVEEKMSK